MINEDCFSILEVVEVGWSPTFLAFAFLHTRKVYTLYVKLRYAF